MANRPGWVTQGCVSTRPGLVFCVVEELAYAAASAPHAPTRCFKIYRIGGETPVAELAGAGVGRELAQKLAEALSRRAPVRRRTVPRNAAASPQVHTAA